MSKGVHDVIIVGAGPGGSGAAAFLGRSGLRTLLLDTACFPREKVCGDGLTPQALYRLNRRAGHLDPVRFRSPAPSAPFDGINPEEKRMALSILGPLNDIINKTTTEILNSQLTGKMAGVLNTLVTSSFEAVDDTLRAVQKLTKKETEEEENQP